MTAELFSSFEPFAEVEVSVAITSLPSTGFSTDEYFYIINGSDLDIEIVASGGETLNGTAQDHFTSRRREKILCTRVSGGWTVEALGVPAVEYVKSPDGTLAAAKAFANPQRYNSNELIVIFGCTTASENGLYFRDLSGSTRVWTQVSL